MRDIRGDNMTDSEMLQLILNKVTGLDEKVTELDKKVTNLENDMSEVKEDIADLKGDMRDVRSDLRRVGRDCNAILDEVERVHSILDKHKEDKQVHTA